MTTTFDDIHFAMRHELIDQKTGINMILDLSNKLKADTIKQERAAPDFADNVARICSAFKLQEREI